MPTNSQIRIARQIFDRFGSRLESVCKDSKVSPQFLAGLISNEAGKDKKGQIKENATRFEPHVFEALKDVRDGARRQYNYITRNELKDASDDAIRALATSYGLTQIMGWHVIRSLKCTVADLRNPEKHLHFAVKLLEITAGKYLAAREYESALRIWNTGRPNGKTYHAHYVSNALAVMSVYADLRKQSPAEKLTKKVKTDFSDAAEETAFFSDLKSPQTEAAKAGIEAAPGNEPQANVAVETTETQTVNTSTGAATQEVATKNEQDVNQPAEVEEPKPQGFLKKLSAGIAAVFGGTMVYDAAGKFAGIQFSTQAIYIVVALIVFAFLGFCVWAFLEVLKQNKRVELEVLAKTAVDRKDLIWRKPDSF